ncbi:MAG: phospholipid carrier-dependent glycosyltransferase [Chloroflexaceae bacterium]|nr:phospholipid carrier-dependent glycosyltransferase [Chloroflexaceae bacterium]
MTTMWFGSLGILLRRALLATGVLQEATFSNELVLMRLPVALVHGGSILLGYRLLRGLFPPRVAFLAALLWATDPFVTAFSRVLHVDGLTGTFATVSLLAACAAWNPPDQMSHLRLGGDGTRQRQRRFFPVAAWFWLVVSGVCAALAALSKSPGIAVVPVVAVLAWSAALVPLPRSSDTDGAAPRYPRLFVRLLPFLGWGAVYVLTILLVWPAVWAAPAQVYHLLRVGVEVEGGSEHVVLNYFLGRPDPAPGPLYYPVVLAIRTTPWTLAGVLLLPFAAGGWRWGVGGRRSGGRTLAVLAGLVILFVAGLSLFPKKLDRYLVPAFPALDILAACGLVGVWEQRPHAVSNPRQSAWLVTSATGATGVAGLVGVTGIVVAVISLAALVNAFWCHPYGVACFNQALGGIQQGIRTVLVGEGEGLGEAAAWLNQQPDITGVKVTSTMRNSLQVFLHHGAQAVSEEGTSLNEKTGYVAIYLRHVQRWQNHPPPPYDRFSDLPPVHAVTIHGVDYVRIYQVPQPVVAQVSQVGFGPSLSLYGYEMDTSALRSTGVLSLTVQWQARAPVSEDYRLFVHVLDDEGQRVGQVDVPPGGPHTPTSAWEPYRYVTWVHPVVLPPDLPPGTYQVAIGLYHPDDFSRLEVRAVPPPGAPDDGPNVLFLEPLMIE